MMRKKVKDAKNTTFGILKLK